MQATSKVGNLGDMSNTTTLELIVVLNMVKKEIQYETGKSLAELAAATKAFYRKRKAKLSIEMYYLLSPNFPFF